MDNSKAAVSNFTSAHGHHATTVEESTSRPVTRDHIKPIRHEETQEALNREVHQDHHHTTVQPIHHQEILPEQHHHQMREVSHREFRHGDDHATRQRLEQEAAQFRNTSTTHETIHTTSTNPVVAGEHVHHHIHETVQPLVHKETIAPEVVHTTVPIHELHHANARHHGISTLPTKTMDEVVSSGSGILNNGHTGMSNHQQYEGEPHPYNRDLETPAEHVMHPHGHHHTTNGAVEQSGV